MIDYCLTRQGELKAVINCMRAQILCIGHDTKQTYPLKCKLFPSVKRDNSTRSTILHKSMIDCRFTKQENKKSTIIGHEGTHTL